MERQGPWVDGGAATDHPPELYGSERLAEPGVPGLADVGAAAVALYQERGYLVVERAFDPDRIEGALEAVLALIGGGVEGFRGVQFETRVRDLPPEAPAEVRQDFVRKLWLFCGHEPRLRALAEDPALTAAVSALMGGAPPLMFQDQALLKPPHGGREKPWHQDNAYFNIPAEAPVVGVWIALDPATPENGCMHVIPGSHRRGPVVHFSRRDWQICDTHVVTAEDVAVPLAPGGLLLFHGLLHHGTPTNGSALRRRALQFHYRPADTPTISSQERAAVFGSDGKDVTC